MKSDVIKLRKEMEKQLDSKRYEHTLGVEFTATALAMRYGEDVKSAQIAGLLHDCAKCISDAKKLSQCEKYKVPVSPVEAENPGLLHAKLGAVYAKKKYDVDDSSILHAIEFHTTGRPNMTLLEKIVFTADYIEPGRKQAPRLEEIRRLAFEDLDGAMLMILEDTLAYLKNGSGEIDPMTQDTYTFYKELCLNKKGAAK